LDIVDRRGEMTLAEVGDLLGVSRERVRQIEEKALGKLAKRVERGVLRAWAHASGGAASLRDAVERSRA
jgi:RNA polymerase primary sigma factor